MENDVPRLKGRGCLGQGMRQLRNRREGLGRGLSLRRGWTKWARWERMRPWGRDAPIN